MQIIIVLFSLFSFTSNADRIAESQFISGVITRIGKCPTNISSAPKFPQIEIQTKSSLMKASVTSHTRLTRNSKIINCNDLKANQKVRIGYVEGNDIMGEQDFWIFDSIEVLSQESAPLQLK